MKMETVKGFRDVEGSEAEKQLVIREALEEIFRQYGFSYIETPIIEYEEFVRGDNAGDEAVSDIFRLKDKGDRKLALRYEFTFQLKRLARNKKLPWRRYQIGQVFRDEPISQNRFRQFTQCDADVIGSDLKDEAELFSMAKKVFDIFGIKFKIYINNRKLLNEILEKEGITDKESVIREIDKLDKLSESEVKTNLKKYNAESILKILKNKEDFFRKYESYKEIKELKKYCKIYGVKIEFLPSLARGLSYYNGTVFEIKSNMKESICSGGSYMVNGISSTGISFGLDRITSLTKLGLDDKKVLIVSLNQDEKAIKIASDLRTNKVSCSIYYGRPGKALDYANSYNYVYALFVGEKEVKSGKYTLKDLRSGKENKVSEQDITKRL